MRDEDIFYSDDEFSDSEDLYQVGPEMYSVAIILILGVRLQQLQGGGEHLLPAWRLGAD